MQTRRSSLLLSNDSAPLHLGVAVGTSLVAIFGPTVTEFGFAPYGEGSVVIERSLDCRPCGIHGGMRCSKKHFRCMTEITPEEVFSVVDRKLQARTDRSSLGRMPRWAGLCQCDQARRTGDPRHLAFCF